MPFLERRKMLTNDKINTLLGITESYQAPQVMMEYMLNKEKRKKLFCLFLEYENKMGHEWFAEYFESEHSDRKVKKQDFTPTSVSKLLSKLTGGNTYFESAAGTGGIMIQYWNEQRMQHDPSMYDPRRFWYQVEEISDRSIPFLIFNMAIRGICGVVIHGDSLERKTKDIYFIRNDSADFLNFSEVIKMNHNKTLENELNIIFC